jgi:methyl-accepting chemotaxis protein
MNPYRWLKSGIAKQLIAPFLLISVFSFVVTAVILTVTMNNQLTQSLEQKSHMLTTNLAAVLGDPLAMGEYDHMQQILDKAKGSDTDLNYAWLLSPDGRVLAATDIDKKNSLLNESEFDKKALELKEFQKRTDPKNPSNFEMAIPVSSAGAQAGILRVGILTAHVQEAVIKSTLTVVLVAALLVVVGALLYWWIIQNGIIQPITRAVGMATRVAQGDLSDREDVTRIDEIGHLQTAMNDMIGYLDDMANIADAIARGDLRSRVEARSDFDKFGTSFNKMVENLHSMIQELAEGAAGLSSAASELATTSNQQSAMISEQATSIQESLVTLEEIRTIVNQASEKAKSVVEISEHSVSVSKAGQEALELTVGAMVKIRDQVAEIAKNIVELSEKTIQIGEITASVNEIAEQSNLLAVNAAIEAIKAGEAGRGFGVVATEVKNLANQSKQATAQVQNILGEIQKATTSTVMVTEEGRKRVDVGVDQVHQIGANFNQLYRVIVESSNAAKQIASATNQQVAGIEQIALGMSNISQAANDSVTGAMQQSSTAQNLSALAHSLNNIVRRYRLS